MNHLQDYIAARARSAYAYRLCLAWVMAQTRSPVGYLAPAEARHDGIIGVVHEETKTDHKSIIAQKMAGLEVQEYFYADS